MTKTTKILAILVLAAIVFYLLIFPGKTEKPFPVRTVRAGKASLTVPGYLPRATLRGTVAGGAAIIGEMDERGIAYEQFVGIFWAQHPVADADLVPTPAYRQVAAKDDRSGILTGAEGEHRPAIMHLRVKKPCGRIIDAELAVIRAFCRKTATYYAVAGQLDPPAVTAEILGKIAGSLACD